MGTMNNNRNFLPDEAPFDGPKVVLSNNRERMNSYLNNVSITLQSYMDKKKINPLNFLSMESSGSSLVKVP